MDTPIGDRAEAGRVSGRLSSPWFFSEWRQLRVFFPSGPVERTLVVSGATMSIVFALRAVMRSRCSSTVWGAVRAVIVSGLMLVPFVFFFFFIVGLWLDTDTPGVDSPVMVREQDGFSCRFMGFTREEIEDMRVYRKREGEVVEKWHLSGIRPVAGAQRDVRALLLVDAIGGEELFLPGDTLVFLSGELPLKLYDLGSEVRQRPYTYK